jgi:hypothetical protein
MDVLMHVCTQKKLQQTSSPAKEEGSKKKEKRMLEA